MYSLWSTFEQLNTLRLDRICDYVFLVILTQISKATIGYIVISNEMNLFRKFKSSKGVWLIAHPHLLVRATHEQFLPTWATHIVGLANESHCL